MIWDIEPVTLFEPVTLCHFILFAEHDTKLADWCWVAPGSEARLLKAIRTVLAVQSQ